MSSRTHEDAQSEGGFFADFVDEELGKGEEGYGDGEERGDTRDEVTVEHEGVRYVEGDVALHKLPKRKHQNIKKKIC